MTEPLPLDGAPVDRDTWATPADLFELLDREFEFTLDPCSNGVNAKCSKFYTPAGDGLAQDWSGHRVFMNPPYSDIAPWMQKAAESACAVAVALVPARVGSSWFHEFVIGRAAEIRFIRGRLRFGTARRNPPFDSMLIVYRPAAERTEIRRAA